MSRGERACERGEAEARVEHDEGAFAVKAIKHETAGEAAHRRRDPIRGEETGKLRRRDVEHLHELRSERHHDHEVQDVCELDAGKREQQPQFAAVRERRQGGGGGRLQKKSGKGAGNDGQSK